MKRRFNIYNLNKLYVVSVGQFFEVLIGARPEPLVGLLGRIGLLYMLEPVFTVLFVVNMNTIWEKVMSTLRALIFRRILIQKVIFDFCLVLIER